MRRLAPLGAKRCTRQRWWNLIHLISYNGDVEWEYCASLAAEAIYRRARLDPVLVQTWVAYPSKA